MFSVNVVRKTRNLEKLIEKMETLQRESIEVGLFPEQGEHPEAGMTYTALAHMHEQGIDGKFPARTIRPLLMHQLKEYSTMMEIGKGINKYLFNSAPLSESLKDMGVTLRDLGKGIFGTIHQEYMPPNSPYTVSMKQANTPLVDQGYLRDAWSFKTSLDNYVVS